MGRSGYHCDITALIVWVIYLRYLLSKKTIESQVEIDKFRLQLEMAPENRQMIMLPFEKNPVPATPGSLLRA